MSILLVFFGIIVMMALYKRYIPVKGTPCIDGVEQCSKEEHLLLLDVRDYQEATKDRIENSLVIPYGYLKRYNKEIPEKKIVLIADTPLVANLAVRFLRAKKFKVVGVYFRRENENRPKRSCCSSWRDIDLILKKQVN